MLYRRIHNNYLYNVPMSGKNKSGVKRRIESNKRKGNWYYFIFNLFNLIFSLILIISVIILFKKNEKVL